MNAQSENRPLCLRCKTSELIALPSPQDIAFFECPRCQRQFARKPGAALSFRWLHPITVALYPVIFDENPVQRCEQIAAAIVKKDSSEQIKQLVQEITLELDDPTQQFREVMDCRASEEDLRKYLRCLADRLGKTA